MCASLMCCVCACGDYSLFFVVQSQLSKKQQRLIKNREAASVSRQKKKEVSSQMYSRCLLVLGVP